MAGRAARANAAELTPETSDDEGEKSGDAHHNGSHHKVKDIRLEVCFHSPKAAQVLVGEAFFIAIVGSGERGVGTAVRHGLRSG